MMILVYLNYINSSNDLQRISDAGNELNISCENFIFLEIII